MKDFARGLNNQKSKKKHKRNQSRQKKSSNFFKIFRFFTSSSSKKQSRNATKSLSLKAIIFLIIGIFIIGWLWFGQSDENITNNQQTSQLQQTHKKFIKIANQTVDQDQLQKKSGSSDKQNQQLAKRKGDQTGLSFYSKLEKQNIPAETTPKETQQYRYIYRLQVGSYRSKEAAYSIKDKLLAIGEKPEVKKVGNWYRVDIKPVYSKRKGDMLKHKIQDAGISGSVLRQIKKIPVKKDKK